MQQVACEVGGHLAGSAEAEVARGEVIPCSGLGVGEFVKHVSGGEAAEGAGVRAVFGILGDALFFLPNEAEKVGAAGAEA